MTMGKVAAESRPLEVRSTAPMHLEELRSKCKQAGYIADDELLTTLQLMGRLGRALLVEGEAGVGKTAIAKALSDVLESPLIRLQCYEGLDSNAAVYEWNYSRQLLSIKLQETRGPALDTDVFTEEFLLERPLLKAIRQERAAVLLIDEIDRADEAFEAFLLELLSEFQITIPELGTVVARCRPHVVLTSNATRELSDALRRRCLYHYLDYPSPEKELAIVRTRLPEIDARLSAQIVSFVQGLRGWDLRKRPGVAETLDWARALIGLGVVDLRDGAIVARTRACLMKTREDVDRLTAPAIIELLAAGA